MNPSPDPDDLLKDVLADATPETFRAEVLRETLRCARRRKTIQKIRRASLLLVPLTLGLVAGSQWLTTKHSSVAPAPRPCSLVSTEKLPEANVVHTVPFAAIVRSSPETAVTVVHTARGPGSFKLVNDDELLALAGPGAMLVRVSPQESQLIREPREKPTLGRRL